MTKYKGKILGVNIWIDMGLFIMFGVGYTNEELHIGLGPIIISLK